MVGSGSGWYNGGRRRNLGRLGAGLGRLGRGYAVMLKPLACAAALAAVSAPALAAGPTPADVAAFSAALVGLPSLDEMHREQASGDLRGFAAAMRSAMDVATVVAERDYPRLGAGWEACRLHDHPRWRPDLSV